MVGAIGVTSTMNAGAEQIASPAEASATTSDAGSATDEAPAAAAATDITPPPVLPWGEKPKRIKRGTNGASSSTLRAQGLSAALADKNSSLVPRPKYGPKGRSSKSGVLRREPTDVVPPKPASAKAAEPESDVNYIYNRGTQYADNAGVYANMTIAKPELAKTDYHTLGEIALQSADGKQIVEVGWTVDRVVNGDDDPHLFVFHWVNDEPGCYNGCGWVQAADSINPGATLTYGVTKRFGIQYYNDGWWIAYDTQWIGYFPEKLWNKEGISFNRSGYVQVFGEVATPSTTLTCTDMGNGTAPNKETAARFSSVAFVDGPAADLFVRATPEKADYQPAMIPNTTRSFRYGGPGSGKCDQ
ncbi:neprosin family prolyl endopeptidase [Actinoplanes sp. URMC 104]